MCDGTTDSRYYEAALRVLHPSACVSTGTCFTHNRAGLELFDSPVEALPQIERLLTELIEGDASQPVQGLDYLIAAHFIVSGRQEGSCGDEFFASAPMWMRRQALIAVSAFFRADIAASRGNERSRARARAFVEGEALKPEHASLAAEALDRMAK